MHLYPQMKAVIKREINLEENASDFIDGFSDLLFSSSTLAAVPQSSIYHIAKKTITKKNSINSYSRQFSL